MAHLIWGSSLLVAAFLVACTIGTPPALAQAPATDVAQVGAAFALAIDTESESDIEDSIRRRSEEWRSALAAGNVDDVLALYHEDASLLPPAPRPVALTEMPYGLVGHGAIRQFVEDYIGILDHKEPLQVTEVLQLGDDVVEIGIWEATHISEAGAEPMPGVGYYLRLWRQDDGGNWKIWRETFN